MVWHPSLEKVLGVLADGKPRSCRDIAEESGLSLPAAWRVAKDVWEKGYLLRSREPVFEALKVFHGRAGIRKNTRAFYLYSLRPEGVERLNVDGREMVAYSDKYVNVRARQGKSKSNVIYEYLASHPEKAYFTTKLAELLREHGVKQSDVMSNLRRYAEKAMIYIYGYMRGDLQTPFQEGFIVTWRDQGRPEEVAIEEAKKRCEEQLRLKASTNPLIWRVQKFRELIIDCTKRKWLARPEYLSNTLHCTAEQLELALRRLQQLYPDIKEVKLFNRYSRYYHVSMSEEDAKARILSEEAFLRREKGRDQRVGHNWEACVEWFVETFTQGARFWSQDHRAKAGRRMDPKRITLHLFKSVGGRRQNAEVDRVWEISPGPMRDPIIYVLSCKWSLVSKRDLDDFFAVLRWSKEFGVNTDRDRVVREDVRGLFAAKAFNPKEQVHINGETISLATYAERRKIQILKASDLNDRLSKRGCDVTVGKVCEYAANEDEVRENLSQIWKHPTEASNVITGLAEKNREIFELERVLQETSP